MNKLFFYSFLFFLISTLILSCRKPPVAVIEKPVIPALSCEVENIDFTYLNSKGKIHFKDKNTEHKTNINIRMRKDSVVWISVNAAAGFEAFRILIRTDSIHILDRINNNYTVRDYDRLSKNLGVPLSYSIIQHMILGNLMVPKESTDEVIQSDSNDCIFRQLVGNAIFTNRVKPNLRKIDNVNVTDGVNTLIINYLKFVPLGSFSFPSENEISLKYKTQEGAFENIQVNIEHNKTEFPDKEINFPFNVPNRFDRK